MRLSGARKEAAGTSVRSAPKLPWEKRKAKAAEEKKAEPKAKVAGSQACRAQRRELEFRYFVAMEFGAQNC